MLEPDGTGWQRYQARQLVVGGQRPALARRESLQLQRLTAFKTHKARSMDSEASCRSRSPFNPATIVHFKRMG
jgi:hypothetical protein